VSEERLPSIRAAWTGSPALLRVAFCSYALLIFTLTHWPQLKVPGPSRTDLVVHATVFGLWLILLTMLALFGSRLSVRNISASALLTLFYAAFDESTQFFSPGRVVALDDFGANAVGVLAGSAIMLVCALTIKHRGDARR
jgi:VanZ family protein